MSAAHVGRELAAAGRSQRAASARTAGQAAAWPREPAGGVRPEPAPVRGRTPGGHEVRGSGDGPGRIARRWPCAHMC